jgi:diguanylate cyclase (GGDEF)-like protein/PAS domain S-box-containing protein
LAVLMLAPTPPNEVERLAALHRLNVLDTPPEKQFDDITRLAAAICEVPISVVSFVDRDRVWIKSGVGLAMTEAQRCHSFCAHAVGQDHLFVIPDAAADLRFRDNPFVRGEPNIRFYAGCPLITPDGFRIGALCVTDRVPRKLTPVQIDALEILARQVVAQLLLRQQVEAQAVQLAARNRVEAELRASERRFRAIFDSTIQYTGLLDTDGTLLEANRTSLVSAGIVSADVIGRPFWDAIWWAHNPTLQLELREGIRRAAAGALVRFEAEHPLADGSVATIDFSISPIRDELGRVVLLVPEGRDVTDRKCFEMALKTSEERFRTFMDHSPAVAFIKDADGRFVYVNEPLTQKFGIPESGWLGKTDTELWGEEIARPLREIDRRVLVDGQMVKLLETVPTPDGSASHWQSYKFPLTEASGKRFLAGMSVDVTAEKKAELALRESEEKFRNVVELLSEGVFLMALDTKRILEANGACLRLFGYSAEEITGLTLYDLVDHDRASVDANTERAARSEHRCSIGRRKYKHKSGHILDVDLSASVVPHAGVRVLSVVVHDVGDQMRYEDCLLGYQLELERANFRLQLLSVTDKLTGVQNRAAFDDALTETFDRCLAQSSELSILLIDIDHFKRFNDSFGHLVGDEILRAVAQSLQDTVRTTDFLARYGGEEFVVILPDTDSEGVMVVAERCRQAIASRHWQNRAVTISVGAATLSKNTPDVQSLVREADEALYRSKESGRNRALHGSGTIGMPAPRRVPNAITSGS